MKDHSKMQSTHYFDYSKMDKETTDMLQDKAYRINQITSKSAYDIGKELSEAKERLAKNGYGNFEEWYRSLGFKKTESYQYINHYNFVRSESEQSKIELFEKAPKSIQTEISKPSSNKKINEAFFNGDITTHKAYKEMEKQLKQKDTQISLKEKRIESLTQRNEDLALKASQPNVVEKEVVKEVKPHDYDGLKSDNQQLSRALKEQRDENEKMRRQIDQWQKEQGELNEKSKRYDELNRAIQEMEGKMDSGQKRIAAVKDITSKLKTGNQLIDELSGLIYLADYDELRRNEFLSQEMAKLVRRLNTFTNDLNERLNQTTILEGEIIDG